MSPFPVLVCSDCGGDVSTSSLPGCHLEGLWTWAGATEGAWITIDKSPVVADAPKRPTSRPLCVTSGPGILARTCSVRVPTSSFPVGPSLLLRRKPGRECPGQQPPPPGRRASCRSGWMPGAWQVSPPASPSAWAGSQGLGPRELSILPYPGASPALAASRLDNGCHHKVSEQLFTYTVKLILNTQVTGEYIFLIQMKLFQ